MGQWIRVRRRRKSNAGFFIALFFVAILGAALIPFAQHEDDGFSAYDSRHEFSATDRDMIRRLIAKWYRDEFPND